MPDHSLGCRPRGRPRRGREEPDGRLGLVRCSQGELRRVRAEVSADFEEWGQGIVDFLPESSHLLALSDGVVGRRPVLASLRREAPGESSKDAFMRRLKRSDPAFGIFEVYAAEHAERWAGAKALTLEAAMGEMSEIERKYALECEEYANVQFGISEEFSTTAAWLRSRVQIRWPMQMLSLKASKHSNLAGTKLSMPSWRRNCLLWTRRGKSSCRSP